MLNAIRQLVRGDLDPKHNGFSIEETELMAQGWCLGGGSGGGSTNTVEKADPWEKQQPYLEDIFSEAQRLYDTQPLQAYPGQSFADFAPETEAALAMQTNRALQGSPLDAGAQQLGLDTLQGNYLYANPAMGLFGGAAMGGMQNPALSGLQETASGQYLDARQNPFLVSQGQQILADVLPQITSQYAAMGRQNSGSAARAAAQGATDALGSLAMENYTRERSNQLGAQSQLGQFGEDALTRQLAAAGALGDIYGTERDRQQAMAGLSPALSETDYKDISALQQVGSVFEDYSQQQINQAMNDWRFANEQPYNMLAAYQNMIQGTYGGTTQQTQTQPRRTLGQGLLGGAVGGAGLGYLGAETLGLTGGQGALLGAAGGGLLGALV